MRTLKQLSIKGLFLPVIALCSLLVVAEPSEAAPVPVTFSFTGAVSEVTGVLFNPMGTSLGTGLMTGSVTFDTAANQIFPGTGVYLNSITGLTLTIPKTVMMIPNTYTASYASGGNNGIVIGNSNPGGGADQFTAISGMAGATINGLSPSSFSMSLIDPSGNVFNNLNLPTTPPSLNSFASGQWRLVFGNEIDGNIVKGSFSNLTAVPLPAAVVLFGVGLTALVGLGAGGLRYLR